MTAYHALANAIILKAVEDYRIAIRESKKEGSRRAYGRELECERFFRSKWYSVLTDVDGEYLIQILNEEVLRDDS